MRHLRATSARPAPAVQYPCIQPVGWYVVNAALVLLGKEACPPVNLC